MVSRTWLHYRFHWGKRSPLEICSAPPANRFYRGQPSYATLIHLSSIRLRTNLRRKKWTAPRRSHLARESTCVMSCANLWKKSPMKPPLSDSSSPDLPNADDSPVQRHATVIRPNRPDDILFITPTHSSSTQAPNHCLVCTQTYLDLSTGRSHSHIPLSPDDGRLFRNLHLDGSCPTDSESGKAFTWAGQRGRAPSTATHFLPDFPAIRLCLRLLAPAAQKDRLSGKLSEEMDASPPSSCLPLSLARSVGRSSSVHGFDGLTEVRWRRRWHWRRLLPLDARACAPARDGRLVRAGTKLGWNSFTRL